MYSIVKFTIGSAAGLDAIKLPKDAKILSAQMRCGELCLWALVEPLAVIELRRFKIYGTGAVIATDPGKHVATVQDGDFVWHIFEQ